MAGRFGNCRYCRVLLGLMTVAFAITVLTYTGVWDPRPAVDAWLTKVLALAEPAPAWAVRAAGPPERAAVMRDGTAVVTSRGFADGYAKADGSRLWQFNVNWAVPAGDVLVAQLRPENPDRDPAPDTGYAVIDPASGVVRWGDKDALAVWAYDDVILDLACPTAGGCELRARAHLGGVVGWSVALPAEARLIRGADPTLTGTRDPADWFGPAASGTPGTLPSVFALPLGGGRIVLVDTFGHRVVRQVSAPDKQTRVAYSGDSVLYVHAEPASVGCLYRVEAVNYVTGTRRWQRDGYNLDTATGADCSQRRDPLGADRHLVVSDQSLAPMVVEADTGAPQWIGVPGQKVLATGFGIAVVESADRKTVQVVDVEQAGQKPTWTGQMGLEPQAAVTRDFVIIRDGDAGRLLVFSRIGMQKRLEIKTKADVIGYGPTGILLGTGRRVGLVSVSG